MRRGHRDGHHHRSVVSIPPTSGGSHFSSSTADFGFTRPRPSAPRVGRRAAQSRTGNERSQIPRVPSTSGHRSRFIMHFTYVLLLYEPSQSLLGQGIVATDTSRMDSCSLLHVSIPYRSEQNGQKSEISGQTRNGQQSRPAHRPSVLPVCRWMAVVCRRWLPAGGRGRCCPSLTSDD